jgi:hypothetical protein
LPEFEHVQQSLSEATGVEALPRSRPSLEFLPKLAQIAAASFVAETEPGNGDLAQPILELHPRVAYTGIYREIVEAEAAERLKSFAARAKLVRGGAEGELPLESGSQDALLTCYALESMRMSHLYMTCSEARRVVREGGHWLIVARDPGRNLLEKMIAFYRSRTGRPSLNITHYISPEDWDTEQDIFLPGLSRMLILRRRSG